MSTADANPVGAGLPAITGKAGALHRSAFIAGKAGAMHRSACIAGKPLKV